MYLLIYFLQIYDIYKGVAVSSECTLSNSKIIKLTGKNEVISGNFPGSTTDEYWGKFKKDIW
jgi:hypothetical protein